ncbi:MAG: ABC transporter substrate-binding protein [Bacteroidales bacterium]|nr:ABC transporter substrate-binding protein [Bacteroidales bacterium]
MRKKIGIVWLILLCLSVQMWAQPAKTVLFLMPFYSSTYDENASAVARTGKELNNIPSFQMMGFWGGAQIALQEYEEQNIPLNIIVRDITNNETKLQSIMEDRELMSQVDLIIAPLFSKPFQIAAQYAKTYQIPIVNPFTSRSDILDGNEYVYKLTPADEANPATLAFMVDNMPHHQIILYADSTKKNVEYQSYVSYFTTHHISYQTANSIQGVLNALRSDMHNVLVVLNHGEATSLTLSQKLLYSGKAVDPKHLTMVVPEKWIFSNTYDVEYYDKLNLHFFSDYYVDFESQQVQLFSYKFTKQFNTLPTLKNFAFQGYDIVRYFVELIRHDMDHDQVKVAPLSYYFSFDKHPDGGYENVNVQFLQVLDNTILPATY